MSLSYTIRRTASAPALDADWDAPAWQTADTIDLVWAHIKSQGPLPKVSLRLLHDNRNIHGIYHVEDHSILAAQTEYNASVCRDSCVEFFFQPAQCAPAYFNLEMSANGNHLIYFVRDNTRVKGGFKDFTALPYEHGRLFLTKGTLPGPVMEEQPGDITWNMQFVVPMDALELYTPAIGDLSGQTWRANFYKCGDKLQHPHWLSWAPPSPLNFHQPEFFRDIHFE